ncbi:Arp2/3 complex 16 kDa subunit ARPC5 [Violaceomyces palustris]|uniref:Arp2/3 complex 16 kDa subunit ARPC5 n=1 Tax=Violaceomyces palustris TaxID=1673888 RepID=A0ACD0NR77_9BASI|nr:Arp2/3 complex 16 kDa subunit ARPC5 [Violaceomyces palustris]
MDSFRKIDVDQFDEDAISDSELFEPDPRSPEEALSEARSKVAQVRTMIGRNDTQGALALVLTNPPYGPLLEEAKQITLATLLEILNSTKSSEISTTVKALDIDQRDNLMKYLYKGLELGGSGGEKDGVNCAVLLGWHEKLTEVAGTGCIVRVMSDRRVV